MSSPLPTCLKVISCSCTCFHTHHVPPRPQNQPPDWPVLLKTISSYTSDHKAFSCLKRWSRDHCLEDTDQIPLSSWLQRLSMTCPHPCPHSSFIRLLLEPYHPALLRSSQLRNRLLHPSEVCLCPPSAFCTCTICQTRSSRIPPSMKSILPPIASPCPARENSMASPPHSQSL